MVPAYEIPVWMEETDTGVVLSVQVMAQGSRERVIGLEGSSLLVTLDSDGVDGQANTMLVRFLAEALAISSVQINVIAGGSGKTKRVQIEAVKPALVSMRLSPK